MPAPTRALGAAAALAGMVGFTCQFAVPVGVGDGRTITLSETTAVYRDVGIAGHLLLLAALGLAAAIRPTIGARVLALGGLGLPWMAGTVDDLWSAGTSGVEWVLSGAVLAGLVVTAVAALLGMREVSWSAGGVPLGDGLAMLVAAATLWGLLGVNWYRVRELTTNTLVEPRFGTLLDTSTGGGRATWVAAAIAVAVLAVAVAGGGWGRRMGGAVVSFVCAFEVGRRVFLSGERLIPPIEQANLSGATLSGEPVLGLLVLPLVGLAAGAWFLTTEGERPAEAVEPVEAVDRVEPVEGVASVVGDG